VTVYRQCQYVNTEKEREKAWGFVGIYLGVGGSLTTPCMLPCFVPFLKWKTEKKRLVISYFRKLGEKKDWKEGRDTKMEINRQ